MENRRGSVQASAPPQPSRQLTHEEFQPPFVWTSDVNTDGLYVQLPGFKEEELKIQVDDPGKIRVSGERRVSESKYSRFNKVFDAPGDSDIANARAGFDNDHNLLFVIMPKKEERGKDEPKKVTIGNEIAKKEEKPTRKGEPKKADAVIDVNVLVDKLLDQISKNKIIIATAILSFSLGMYVSRKLRQ